MENLEEVLLRESVAYDGLLKLSMKKTSIIIRGDLQALKDITEEEQNAVGAIHRIEVEREQVMKSIAGVLNTDVEVIKIKDLLQVLERRPEERQKLAAVYDKLRRSVHEMKRVNEQNKSLIEKALEMTQFEMNAIQAMRSAPETANYNKTALNDGSFMGPVNGRFDAKQ